MEATMLESASEFRRAVAARNRDAGGRRRFGADLRSRAVALAEAARREGRTWESIASELEVSSTLLQKWCRDRSESPFVRVEVDEAAAVAVGGAVRVSTPGGYVVEGLDVASAAELLRRLR